MRQQVHASGCFVQQPHSAAVDATEPHRMIQQMIKGCFHFCCLAQDDSQIPFGLQQHLGMFALRDVPGDAHRSSDLLPLIEHGGFHSLKPAKSALRVPEPRLCHHGTASTHNLVIFLRYLGR